ncbi:MAG: DUF4392 domain-containing protein [Planctomycetaceae bacterium]|nr:DUF4392 domain-containing protein [Planctomycetaceae bacterium]
MHDELVTELERLIRRDPGQRGLLGQTGEQHQFGVGSLSRAATELATRAKSVVLVTGFYIPGANIPASETDGPPGTLYLAKLLEQLGIEVTVVTDSYSASAVKSVARHFQFSTTQVHVVPQEPEADWCREFFETGPGCQITHLVAIERAGPGYTSEIFLERYSEPDLAEFLNHVPIERQGGCHNMRGVNIDAWTAPLHELFESVAQFHPEVRTIGIGDGGNEIGMGQLDWRLIQSCLPLEGTGHIPCRVETDELIVAGTSNWGALALTAAVALLKNRLDLIDSWTAEHHQLLLEKMVIEGPAVDGVTGQQEPTVDGLPFLTYIQPWLLMRQLLNL